jgi:hemoglobin
VSVSLYQELGGEAAIRGLVQAFYDEMEREPGVAPLLAVHPDLPRARERLFEFLSGWTGGPPLYVRKHGHPRLRARHLHVEIDDVMVGMWMHCMERALAETVVDEALREVLRTNLDGLAHHMRNV